MRFPCGGFAVHSGISGGGRRCGDKSCVYCNDPLKYIDANWHFPSIECPKCKMVSYNTNDIKHKFCGNCHDWHDYMKSYCSHGSCKIRYVFEHHHIDEHTITFRNPDESHN